MQCRGDRFGYRRAICQGPKRALKRLRAMPPRSRGRNSARMKYDAQSECWRCTLGFGKSLVVLLYFGVGLWAQPLIRGSFVRAFGQSTVSVKPDLARVEFSVVTQASTDQDASSQNAMRPSNVLSQLMTLRGPSAQ